ncbi:DUF4367 domain-containing protein [Clostridium sp. 'White wine YQ']|uniref:DUF4367 domain-containing protein n=1 Tax=Clostridium sp. 'White wine YQ' TaxID=3027474 RepID=UPI002366724B|nr:DUF4367 domain-containing protein [Clostridium sp. 'White wine YQ']MDD7796316.1 DUF4367 domain-containing protein [Clostridium sp. 'White wine YQ']
MLRQKKFVIAVCAALLVTAGITVQPVKAAISSTLSIFRVEKMKGITVTLEDIQQIQQKLSSGKGEISLDKIGSIKMQGGDNRSASQEDVKNLPDIDVEFPSHLGSAIPSINIVEPRSVDFTLNAKNVNQIMKSYGSTKLLPENIDGKTFKVNFTSQVTMNYRINDKLINITQTKSPEIIVPKDVNVDELYNAIIDMPIIPQDLQSQLKSIKDWKNALYIPVVDSKMTQVDINGAKGYMTKDYGNSEGTHESAVIWYDKGVIYVVSGEIENGEILNIARSMR